MQVTHQLTHTQAHTHTGTKSGTSVQWLAYRFVKWYASGQMACRLRHWQNVCWHRVSCSPSVIAELLVMINVSSAVHCSMTDTCSSDMIAYQLVCASLFLGLRYNAADCDQEKRTFLWYWWIIPLHILPRVPGNFVFAGFITDRSTVGF